MSATDIETIKSQAIERLTELTTDPKPTYSIDGQSVSWGEYLKQLQDLIAWCNAQINLEAGPYETETRTIGG